MNEPGHVSLTIHREQSEIIKGLWPLRSAIPRDMTIQERIRYLRNNSVPGVILDDLITWQDPSRMRIEKQWSADSQQVEAVENRIKVSRPPNYSLRPDRFSDSHNCVSWCVEIINQTLALECPLPEDPTGNITKLRKHLIQI